jgi:hypothetical protein
MNSRIKRRVRWELSQFLIVIGLNHDSTGQSQYIFHMNAIMQV